MATAEATVWTALLDSSAGSSMVLLVMRRVVAPVTDSDAPFGASLVRKTLSLMETGTGPAVKMAPPLPEETRNS